MKNITTGYEDNGDFLFLHHEILMESLTPALVYMVILFVLGVPGNLTVLYVYFFKCRESTTRVFIMSLALLDIIHCVLIMPSEIALLDNFDNFDYPVLCKITRFLSSFINNSSAFILIAIAIDRYKRICRPHGKNIDPWMAKKLVVAAFIFAVVTSWQMCVLYGTRTLKHGKTCLISDHMEGKIFPTVYIYILVVGQGITDILLITFYSLVGREVCVRKAQRRQRRSQRISGDISQRPASIDFFSTDSQSPPATSSKPNRFSAIFKKETPSDAPSLNRNNENSRSFMRQSRGSSIRQHILSKTTIMMFLVTVTFIISFVPHTAAVIIRYQAKPYVQSLTVSGMEVYQIFVRSYFMNSVLNPFIYCFVSKQFRKQCKESFQCIKCFKRNKN